MDIASGHMSYAHAPPNKRNCWVIMDTQISLFWYSYRPFCITFSSKTSHHGWMSMITS